MSVSADRDAPLLQLDDLAVSLPPGADRAFAAECVSLNVKPGEVVCVVGESGSGKSMTASAVMRLLPPSTSIARGRILFEGQDLASLPESAMRRIRGARIGMIFQDPMTTLNPIKRIGRQIAEVFELHTDLGREQIGARVLALLESVHIRDPERVMRSYPHQISGGQRQRAMIAMALALKPRLLIADEPTTALDVTTQAQILALIRELQARTGTGVLFITHDFGVVADIADRVAVMQSGRIVEQGTAQQVLGAPKHPYTRRLIAAVPKLIAPPPRPQAQDNVLVLDKVSKVYASPGLFGFGKRQTLAVNEVSLELPRGAAIGVVGESGSGKSTLARCIVRLLEPDAGKIWLDGIDYGALKPRELRKRSQAMQMVFQDPFASLNPRRRARDLVAQGLLELGVPRSTAYARAAELFTMVGLDPAALERYPHEFSGGQRQRIGLARALALEPKVVVADEPVSALDVIVQAQVLDLLAELRQRLGISLVFITHDLRVTAQICDFVAVMQNGRIVEQGPTASVFAGPEHSYTQLLLGSIPGQRWVEPSAHVAVGNA
ncbi:MULTISPECIES: ABC transporter ATP-binding protein [unclassified Bradyrhizobium]|uniref:ABC transporter ATP-binding protein n=1 Tax=unclassified Bradyrhizobium TaxID=2631580 RepID=UPI001FDEF131|nr:MULTISPECIES: ABC transporter ATP-binding protein [unclassified Bradyrhizobium]